MSCSSTRLKSPNSWLANCPEFSRPICQQLREEIFTWEPDLSESLKWHMLCFSGRKLVCALSGCKKHVGLHVFRGAELEDPVGLFSPAVEDARMRSLRITSANGYSRKALRKLLHDAVVLDADPTRPPLPPQKRKPLPIPDFFARALRKNQVATENFSRLAPTYQREYLVWLSSAKREETREKRLAETLIALAAGRKWSQRRGP